jgi:hypothetical protein
MKRVKLPKRDCWSQWTGDNETGDAGTADSPRIAVETVREVALCDSAAQTDPVPGLFDMLDVFFSDISLPGLAEYTE